MTIAFIEIHQQDKKKRFYRKTTMGNWVNRQSKNNNQSRSSIQLPSNSRPGIKVRNVSICREREIVETQIVENTIITKVVTVQENRIKGPPDFTTSHKQLVVESWHYVQDHVAEVGITAFMDLFKVSPDLRQTFSFFEYYKIDDEKFYILVTKHALRILGMVSQLVKQMKSKDSEESDRFIHDTLFPLGRKHVNYGSNVVHMEMLGLLIVKSLMKTIPRDEVNEHRFERINDAYFQFFKVIVYWLKYGFQYQTKHLM